MSIIISCNIKLYHIQYHQNQKKFTWKSSSTNQQTCENMPTWNHQSLQSSTTCLDCQGSHDLLLSLQLAMGIPHSIEVDRDHLVAPPLALHRLELHENVAVIEKKKQKDLILPRNLEKFYKSSYFPESDRSSLLEFLEARYPWVGILGSQIR